MRIKEQETCLTLQEHDDDDDDDDDDDENEKISSMKTRSRQKQKGLLLHIVVDSKGINDQSDDGLGKGRNI